LERVVSEREVVPESSLNSNTEGGDILYIKCLDEGLGKRVCAHIKEAIHAVELDGDYFRAGISLDMAINLVIFMTENFHKSLLTEIEDLPEDFHLEDPGFKNYKPESSSYGYYRGNPSFAIFKFK